MIRPGTIALLLLAAGFAAAGRARGAAPGTDRAAGDPTIILGRPTDRSITVSVLSASTVAARLEYGPASQPLAAATAFRTLEPGVPVEFELGGLQPNTRYGYLLVTGDARPLAEGVFHTQRSPGGTFTFALQGDSHPERPGKMFDAGLYVRTLRNVAVDPPDFYIMLGDDFSIERLIERRTLTPATVERVYADQRAFLGLVGCRTPLFLVNGNHEQAARCNLDGTPDSAAALAGRARTRFFPLPAPDAFYTGNGEEVPHVGLPRDYYAWTWGDALFVVIDPYWHSPVPVDGEAGARGQGGETKRRDPWSDTMGDAQYQWLARTLTASRARWKFVFCHHVLGTGRGGVEMAALYEWGGRNRRGEWEFDRRRPGWALPVHQLLAKTGVTIVFQGHDHLFARQELDGVIYQSCPNPADPTYQAFNRDAYRSGDVRSNSGHLRVTVAPGDVAVDYIRSWRVDDETDGRRNGETAFHYVVRTKEPAP